jgi:hypothetical protein
VRQVIGVRAASPRKCGASGAVTGSGSVFRMCSAYGRIREMRRVSYAPGSSAFSAKVMGE